MAPLPDTQEQFTGVDVHRAILRWNSEDDTAHFARALAALPATRDCFIELRGELGAGKTTLVRHLLRALGVNGRIKSPTYAVMEPYEVNGLAIAHFDFYRFGDPREWEDAGFRDVFASPGLKLAEWPQKARGVLPRADLCLDIHIEPDGLARTAQVEAGTPKGRQMLQALHG